MTLVLIFGPPAVGKMTVGRALADASDFRLFHNHHTIEPLLDVFDYGTPPFMTLLGEFRHRVMEEAAQADTNLVVTFVWDLEEPAESETLRRHFQPFVDAGRPIRLVELASGLDTRLQRNRTEYRLAEKKSKRNLEWSDGNVREMEKYLMNTDRSSVGDELVAEYPHLRIDNTDRPADDVAAEILRWLADQ